MTEKKKPFIPLTEQIVSDSEGNVWSVACLVDSAKDLEIFDLPLKHLCTSEKTIAGMRIPLFVKHMEQVLACDLTCPIILDDEGGIFDGRHRVAKALLEKVKQLKAVRFEKDPPPTYIRPK